MDFVSFVLKPLNDMSFIVRNTNIIQNNWRGKQHVFIVDANGSHIDFEWVVFQKKWRNEIEKIKRKKNVDSLRSMCSLQARANEQEHPAQ